MEKSNKSKILIAASIVGLGLMTPSILPAPSQPVYYGTTAQLTTGQCVSVNNIEDNWHNEITASQSYISSTLASSPATYPPQPDDVDLGAVVTTKELTDSGLYSRLLGIYASYYGSTPAGDTNLRRDMFKGMDFTAFGGVLDLSNKNIVELIGLDLLNFNDCTGLECVNLSNNKLTKIAATEIQGLSKISSINLSNNSLESVDLSNLENLTNIDLGNNKLSAVNLTSIQAATPTTIILNNNQITDLSQISFRRSELIASEINLYVVGNYIANITAPNSKVKVIAGLYGLSGNNTITKDGKNILKYNKITNFADLGLAQDIQLVIVKDSDLSIVRTINNSDVDEDVDILSTLGYDKYQIYYRYIDGSSIYADNHTFVDLSHSPHIITIRPANPTITYLDKDGNEIEYDNSKPLSQDIVIKLTAADPNCKIKYMLNGKEWVEGNTITIPADQKTVVAYKVVANSSDPDTIIESDVTYINFVTAKGFGWSEVLLILAVIVGFLIIFFVAKPIIQYFINRPLVIDKKKNDNDDAI